MSGWLVAVMLLQAHGVHPSAARPALYEYLLVGVATVAMVWTLYLAFRYTTRPGERDPKHIKHRILEDDDPHG